ncbi:MAG: hypothetical protein C4617_02285 [Candidatus Liberibacter europaeus]|uniref:Uncharacterized protein n=1 Tax=Candidatus Liberibacter europaeus TaxID=744859 RepID=A0A2T4VY11_9HYPH|nr:hypothetical protein [Candidatus Liberibacter europaeus]PTL86666.1 MAG: hypothetical protein C4617_02285 [Candidatus Liberibacter europaeus]
MQTQIPLERKYTKKQEEICNLLKRKLNNVEREYSKSNREFDDNSDEMRNLQNKKKNNNISTEENEALDSKSKKSKQLFAKAQHSKISRHFAEQELEKCLNTIH